MKNIWMSMSSIIYWVTCAGQMDMKLVASSSSALQSLQDGSLRVNPLWRELNLEGEPIVVRTRLIRSIQIT